MEALSHSLERLPAAFHADRAALLELLRRDGILHATERQPILSRDGTTARWMLNSLQVTLTTRGAELAARCVLALLERFDGRQIATIGFTATPILNACIQLSGGRCHGLLVRPERKPHGARKLIEGPIDPHEPTIVLDDSISSGTSMQLACRHLEEAGLRVEGGIFLVRFGWYGGFARMQELGYHVEAVSDIWTDFIDHMEDEPPPVGNPSKIFPDFRWSAAAAPEGLHPAELARLTLRAYAADHEVPRPPRTLDADYPAAGGVWVSLRSTADVHLRHARDGFWHLPGEPPWPAPEAVIMAALRTAAALPPDRARALIDDSAVAVTFFTALEACPVGAARQRSLRDRGAQPGASRLDGRRAAAHAGHPQRMGPVPARPHEQRAAGLVRAARHFPPRRDQGGRARRALAAERRAGAARAAGARAGRLRRGGGATGARAGARPPVRRTQPPHRLPTRCCRPRSIRSTCRSISMGGCAAARARCCRGPRMFRRSGRRFADKNMRQ